MKRSPIILPVILSQPHQRTYLIACPINIAYPINTRAYPINAYLPHHHYLPIKQVTS